MQSHPGLSKCGRFVKLTLYIFLLYHIFAGMELFNNDTAWMLENEDDYEYLNISTDHAEPEPCQMEGATDKEMAWFNDFSYWTEGVVQLGLGKLHVCNKLGVNWHNSWICTFRILS